MTTGATATQTAAAVESALAEWHRLLVAEAVVLRNLMDLLEDGAPATEPRDGPPVGDTSGAPRLQFTPARRKVVAAIADCLARGEVTTYGMLRIRSGVAQRTFARTLSWAVGAHVVTRTERGYLPGPAWGSCADSDAEWFGLVPPRQPSASQSTTP